MSSSVITQSHCPYIYSPLREDAQEIRLLTLLPGRASSDIRLCLDPVPFTDDAVPEFEALSYTWGSPDNPVNIFVGASGFHTLPVTQNLAEALPYLRYEDKPRILWIDAICVNQQDVEERNSQVARMADIYSKAKIVVVWLGPESHDSPRAIEAMQWIDSNIAVDRKRPAWHSRSDEKHWIDEREELRLEKEDYEALYNFFSRPWFSRLWIWQEVRLASSSPVVVCGNRLLHWTSIGATAFLLQTPKRRRFILEPDTEAKFELCILRINMMSENESRHPFLTLLIQTQLCLCTDPRDRIFALLSLLKGSHKDISIQPDYSKNVSEVYQHAMLQLITHDKQLDFLIMVDFHEDTAYLPSWVPDWSVRPLVQQQLEREEVQACYDIYAKTHYYGNGILGVTGVTIGVIEDLEVFELQEGATDMDIVHSLKRILTGTEFLLPFTADAKGLTTLWLVLSSCYFSERFHPPRFNATCRGLKESLRFISCLLESTFDERGFSWNERRVFNLFAHKCLGRAIFITRDGHLGMAPKAAQPGDIVTVLLGCPSAMILRPTKDNRFRVVGEALCHGFMDGEALLGPLPDGIESVRQWNEELHRDSWTCIDRSTGRLFPDPRLSGLPRGSENDEIEEFQQSKRSEALVPVPSRGNDEEEWESVSSDESEDYGLWHHDGPRLTYGALLERGVDLQEFLLI